MGQRGHEHIRSHYGLVRVAERWEGIYRDVLRRNRRAQPTPVSREQAPVDNKAPEDTAV
jgi:hypothetical protein